MDDSEGKEKDGKGARKREEEQPKDMEVLAEGEGKGAGEEKRKKVGTYKKMCHAGGRSAVTPKKKAGRKRGGDVVDEVNQKRGEEAEGG